MTINKEKIRAAAMAANTHGAWKIGAMETGMLAVDGDNNYEVTGFIDPPVAIHIIESNPSTVLSLLDALDKAEKDREVLLLTMSKIEYSMSQATIHGNDKYREIYLSKELAEQAIKSVKMIVPNETGGE